MCIHMYVCIHYTYIRGANRDRHVETAHVHSTATLEAAVPPIHTNRVATLPSLARLHTLFSRPDETHDAVRLVVFPQAVHFDRKVACTAVLAKAMLRERDVRQLTR